ncbi:DUF3859 domain-containing protein [Thalassotalea sp. PLHSN55]|uniref:DUF3859 domain-containing protein n=1 Tax=Thalassotalea sp. PLHSN55 TaxID=3435888 RepID=UPI003F82489D
MAKVKPQFKLASYGIYTQWQNDAKELPQIKEYTLDIPAEVDIEFGLILNVKKGKGIKLDYCIYHPNIPDEDGNIMLPFTGDVYVKNSDWDFFLGDTIWAPVSNKTGAWRIVIEYQGKVVAEKTFDVSEDNAEPLDEFAQLTRRHRK